MTESNSKENRVLLLLHGFPSASYDYVDVWDSLSGRFRKMITFDFLGFGFSDKPDAPYSLRHQADIVESLLKELSIGDVHILCHDYAVSVVQ